MGGSLRRRVTMDWFMMWSGILEWRLMCVDCGVYGCLNAGVDCE